MVVPRLVFFHPRQLYLESGIRKTQVEAGIVGVALAMLLFNLYAAIRLRDVAHSLYCLMLVWFISVIGFSLFKVYGGAWADRYLLILSGQMLFGSRMLFMQLFLQTARYVPRWHKVLSLSIGYAAVSIVAMVLGDGETQLIVQLLCVIQGIVAPILIVPAILVWRAGYRPARYAVCSEGLALVAASYALAVVFGASFGLGETQIPLLASALAFVIFTFGLVDRVNVIREERDVQAAMVREAKIREQESQLHSERKSAFLASMSHELRTPMNAIKGFTNLVMRRGKDELSERNQENLQKVSHASDHLLTMINDLLDLSKIEAGRMEVDVKMFDVREMIE